MLVRSLFAASIAALACPSLFAQTPKFEHRQGGWHEAVHFSDASHGCIVSDGGRIHRWNDGTGSWEQALTPNDCRDQLRGVFVLDDSDSWACGERGIVLRSTDDGQTWVWPSGSYQPIMSFSDTPTEAVLFDVWMLTDSIGFLVGEDGVLLRTTNGGVSWSHPGNAASVLQLPNPDPYDLYKIHVIDGGSHDGTIVIAADRGLVLYSTDSGTTWQTAFAFHCGNGESYLEHWSLEFVPGTGEGYLVGGAGHNGGALFRTEDAGVTWERVMYIRPFPWQIGPDGSVKIDQTGEHEWVPTLYGVAIVPSTVSSPEPDVLTVGYASAVYRWIGDGLPGTFVYHTCLPPLGFVEWSGTEPYWLLEHFEVQPGDIWPGLPPLSGIHSVPSGTDGTETWLTGAAGTIRHSVNRGVTWSEMGSVQGNRLAAGDFANPTDGCFTGQGRVITRTLDGGVTVEQVWPTIQVPVGEQALEAFDLSVNGIGHGLVVGERDTGAQQNPIKRDWVLATTDFRSATSGWTDVTANLPPNQAANPVLHACHVVPSSGDLYVAGNQGYVAKAVNGWTNWSLVKVGAGLLVKPDLRDIVVLPTSPAGDIGFVVGRDSAAWTTTNGGSTWTKIQLGPGWDQGLDLFAVATNDTGTETWAVGEDSLVLRRTTGRFMHQPTPATLVPAGTDFLAVDVVQDVQGTLVVISGENGALLMYDGTIWTSVKSQTSTDIHAVDFQDLDHGFAIAQPFFIAEYD